MAEGSQKIRGRGALAKINLHRSLQKGSVLILVVKKKISLLIAAVICLSCILSGCGSSDSDANALSPSYGIGKVFFTEGEPDDEPTPQKHLTVCIDPGHGFTDTGTESEFLGAYHEDDITIAVSKKLADDLRELGYDVIMTHDGVTFPKASNDDGNNIFHPNERTSYINSFGDKIDYVVSIHCNSFDDPSVSGIRVFYYQPSYVTGESEDAKSAAVICDQLESDFPDAVKPICEHQDLALVRDTGVTSVLVEMGFATNEADAKNMLDVEWQSKFAKSLADGIDRYFDEKADT